MSIGRIVHRVRWWTPTAVVAVITVAVAALGATSILGPASSRAVASGDPMAVSYDVAVLGSTFHLMLFPGAGPPNRHAGSSFMVEGNIYPAGTIGSDIFDPASATPIGRFFCRGWFLDTPDRPQPGLITTQEFVIGTISADHQFPTDQLATSGLEAATPVMGFDPAQPAIRSVVGGTGMYRAARGTAIQHYLGHNTTKLIGGVAEPAPNFRFDFDLRP